ncbi:MAG TPA: PASTA domain-containing protein [Gaiellaceae bacterium]|nr:PASTA domain-containing protein [Gaiellaceae bacterium]
MGPPELDDTDFLVWPFRRQLVDETALPDEATVTIVPQAPVSPPPPRRRTLAPLRLAGPVGFAVFVLTVAGAAAFGDGGHGSDLGAPAVEAAVPPPPAAAQARRQLAARILLARRAARAEPRRRAAAKPKPAPRAVVAVVAAVVGLDKHDAAGTLLAEGYGVRVYGVPSQQPLDRVVAQAPAAGTRLRAGEYVRINVSAGRADPPE